MALVSGARANKATRFFVGLAVAAVAVAGCTAKPVASVNGTKLTEKEFHELTEAATGLNPQGPTVGQQVLHQWILNTLMEHEAKRLNVYPSQEELDARVDAIRKRAAFLGQDFEQSMQQQGLNPETFKERVLSQMIEENVMFRGIQVSDAEIEKEFDTRQAQFGIPEMVRVSQLTVDSPDKLKLARNDLGGNADFSLVASSYSKDPFQQAGGKVSQPLPRQGDPNVPVDPKVLDAAFKLKEGQVSEPVQVGGTWVIVRLDEKIPAKTPRMEEVKDFIRAALRQQKAQSQGQAEVRKNQQEFMEATRGADIQVNRPEYQAVLQQFSAPPGGPGPMGGPGGGAPPAVPGG